MLAITTLVIALLAGAFTQAATDSAKQRLRSERLLLASLAAFIIVGGLVCSVVVVARPVTHEDVFEPEPEHFNRATIPSTAIDDPTELPDDVPQAELADDNGI